MKVLIVGAGSIGTRHAELFQKLAAPEILVVEPDEGRRAIFASKIHCRQMASFESALQERPDVAVICSPTSLHVPHCLQALRANCHVLLEKPVSHTAAGVELALEELRARNRVVLVSCNFRFDPALSQIKRWLQEGLIGRTLTCRASYGQDLRQCRPNRDYRTVYSSSSALGGGVLLDCVHELDYLSWFFGAVETVSAMVGRLGDLEMDADDSANLLLRFSSGVRALVQLDYFRPEYNRSCEIVGTEGILQWSYSPKMLRCFSRRSGLWSTRAIDDREARDAMYAKQIQHFLACIAGEEEPAQNLGDAANTLMVAVTAAESAKSRMEKSVPALPWADTRPRGTPHRPPTGRNMTTIIQARMNSSRLPGKVLADIAGKPMLARVVERVRAASYPTDVVVATSLGAEDDVVESLCAKIGTRCFRGHPLDVLDRYYQCAKEAEADVVVRITGDCPLIDPALIDEMIHIFRLTDVDYASNRRYGSPNALRAFPDGLDVEVFRFKALEVAWKEAVSVYDREHVTPFIWRNVSRFNVLYTESQKEVDQRQWTVDYREDLEFIRTIYGRLQKDVFGMDDVLGVLDKSPRLATLNAHLAPLGDWRYARRQRGSRRELPKAVESFPKC